MNSTRFVVRSRACVFAPISPFSSQRKTARVFGRLVRKQDTPALTFVKCDVRGRLGFTMESRKAVRSLVRCLQAMLGLAR